MKAAQINNYGDTSAIQIHETDKPTITDDQVLVHVAAAGINPFDLMVLNGGAQAMAPLQFPATLGIDLAGTIVEVGNNVTGFAIGDSVYGTANAMFGNSGAFAEFAAVAPSNLATAPSTISLADAASLPTAGVSGLQAIDALDVRTGQKVFIHGGAGGAGSIAIQIAKARGAYVASTASAANSNFVRSLGADEVIDYKTQNFLDIIKEYDAVFTTVRSSDINDVLTVLKKGGVAVSLVGPFDDTKVAELDVTASAQMTHVTTESLNALRQLVDDGTVVPAVDKTFTLDQTVDAYTALQNDSIKGKIIILIKK